MNKSLYFPHDYNSANDHKILFLRQQFGIEGYGIFWYIVEQLAQSGGKLPLKIIPVLAMQIQTTPDKVKAVVMSYELFEIQDDQFFSVRLNTHLELRQRLVDEGRRGGLKSGEKRRNLTLPSSPPTSNKESKEIKKEIHSDSVFPSFEDFWNKYGKKVNRIDSEKLWAKVNQIDREKIMDHLNHYGLKEKQFKKDPERYLKKRVWNDEVTGLPLTQIKSKPNPGKI